MKTGLKPSTRYVQLSTLDWKYCAIQKAVGTDPCSVGDYPECLCACSLPSLSKIESAEKMHNIFRLLKLLFLNIFFIWNSHDTSGLT